MKGRSVSEALRRGAASRCPSCGRGPLFRGFLSVRDTCEICGEDLHHQRADDAPPYIVMSFVGILVIALMLIYEIAYTPPMWHHAAIFLPLTVALSLALLRPVKGCLVGIQWAKGMHGFAPEGRENWT